jgi:hypothetical protein
LGSFHAILRKPKRKSADCALLSAIDSIWIT